MSTSLILPSEPERVYFLAKEIGTNNIVRCYIEADRGFDDDLKIDPSFKVEIPDFSLSYMYYNPDSETAFFNASGEIVGFSFKTKEVFRNKTIANAKKLFSYLNRKVLFYEKEDEKMYRFNLQEFKEEETENKVPKLLKESEGYITWTQVDDSEKFFVGLYT